MADIKVRGYVNHGKSKKNGDKGFSTFSLSETNKDKKTGQKSYTFYDVTDWAHENPPAEGSFVNVQGYLKVRTYEKDGVKKQSLDVNCQELTVSPPRDQTDTAAKEDPFTF